MNLLLDTCTFLWMLDEVERLGPNARPALEDGRNRVVLHQVSSWEIQLKHDRGKLPLPLPPAQLIPEAVERLDLAYQPLLDEDIWFLGKLPALHADPFDRILLSHALGQGRKLVTPDPRIARYPVPVVW